MRTILSLMLLLALGSLGFAADYMTAMTVNVETLRQGDVALITCQIKKPVDVQIQVLNAQGRVVRTLLAYQTKMRAEYPWNGKDEAGTLLPAGAYTVRVQAGLRPQLDKTFGTDGVLDDFTSPFDVALDQAGNIYVADRGDKVICKFTPEGKPAEGFGAGGKMIPQGSPAVQTVKVDQAGYLYTTGAFHNVGVYDKKGNFVRVVGGWFLDEKGQHTPENTVNPLGIALGDDKIYITRGGADGVVAFNPSFAGKDGFIFKSSGNPFVYSPQPPNIGYCGPGLDAAPGGTIYGVGLWGDLRKGVDTGEDIAFKYACATGPDGAPMKHPTDTAVASDGTIWVADWGSGRIVRFFDTGGALVPVFAFGEQSEGDLALGCFQNPHGLAISADGKYLYLAEDGEAAYNYETKQKQLFTGAHRLSRWTIDRYADQYAQALTVTAAGGAQ